MAKNAGNAVPKRTIQTSHRIMTRSRTRQFRFLDLPAEIRNEVYKCTLQLAAPIGIGSPQTADALLIACKQLRAEALPLHFAINTFTSQLRTNFCVRSMSWAGSKHINFAKAGVIGVRQPASSTTLPDGVARFRHLRFELLCGCCVDGLPIGHRELHLDGRVLRMVEEPKTAAKVGPMRSAIREAREHLFANAYKSAIEIAHRNDGRGFTLDEIKRIAKCFCEATADDTLHTAMG